LANAVDEQSDARQALDRPFGLALSHLLGLGDRRRSALHNWNFAMATNRRIIQRFLLLLVMAACFRESTLHAQDDKVAIKAEMQVLSKYLGTWDEEYDFPSRAGAVTTAEWVLDGKFVRRTGKLNIVDLEWSEMLTFDPVGKSYRRWTFDSTGFSLEYKGTWDDQTSTMTWIAENRNGPGSQVSKISKFTFTDSTIMKWETESRNSNNELVGRRIHSVAKMRPEQK